MSMIKNPVHDTKLKPLKEDIMKSRTLVQNILVPFFHWGTSELGATIWLGETNTTASTMWRFGSATRRTPRRTTNKGGKAQRMWVCSGVALGQCCINDILAVSEPRIYSSSYELWICISWVLLYAWRDPVATRNRETGALGALHWLPCTFCSGFARMSEDSGPFTLIIRYVCCNLACGLDISVCLFWDFHA